MKKLVTASILIILFFAGNGWAKWWGGVYDKDTGAPVVGAGVWTYPWGGTTNSGTLGYYELNNASGMEEGEFYVYVAAAKGIKNGRTYTNDYYYEAILKANIAIEIHIPNK